MTPRFERLDAGARSVFARHARELITTVAPPFLVNHSVRAYAWAVELALHDKLRFDPEILYVSAILHDIGLVPEYDLGGCFETDGAIAAERFALEPAGPPNGPAPSTTSSSSTWPTSCHPSRHRRSCCCGTRPAPT